MALEPESARNWRKQAQFDDIGPFVKAWAAFNPWFREHSGSWQDARGIEYVCSQDNPVKNTAFPLLRANSERATEFKAKICTLHEYLDVYDLNERDKDDNTHRSALHRYASRSGTVRQCASKAGACAQCSTSMFTNAA